MIAYIFISIFHLPIMLCNYPAALDNQDVIDGYAGLCEQIIIGAPYLEVWQ